MLGEARGGCDAQDASQFSGTARRVLCFVEDGECRFHAPEVLGACFGQRQGARATCEERSEEHTSELQSLRHLVCRLLLEKKKTRHFSIHHILQHSRLLYLESSPIKGITYKY